MTVGKGMPRRISEMVDVLVGIDEFQKYRSDCLDYPNLRQRIVRIRRARGARKRFTEVELCAHGPAETLPDHVVVTFGPVPINDDLRQEFAESVDLTKCPAFRANWAFHEGSISTTAAHELPLVECASTDPD